MIEIQKNKILLNAMNYVNNLLVSLEKYYYHHYEHALDVMNRAIYLWEKEWLSDKEIEMLAIAWLFHDTWYIIEYDHNEKYWAKIAENYLKTILFPKEKIKIVVSLIMATDPRYKNPKNIMEKIIKDSDMDNLWRDDFFEKWNSLKKEIEIIKSIKINNPEWYHSSLILLRKHNFYTITQIRERFPKKKENEEKLSEKIKK